MPKWVKKALLFLCLFILGSLILFYPPTIGLANNTDFGRALKPLGLEDDYHFRYFYFQQKFQYSPEGPTNPYHYESTQLPVLQIAKIANNLFYTIVNGTVPFFDIRFLGIVYLFLHCLALVILYHALKGPKKISNVLILILLAFIFMSDGYLVYFDSFFGEPLILVSFMLYTAASLFLINKKSLTIGALSLYLVSGILFIGAKVANTPMGVVMALFTVLLLFNVRTFAKRAILIAGICLMLLTSLYFFNKTPQEMTDVTNYNSLFYGVLKNSPTPENDLKEFGIDGKYAVLANTNAYVDHKGFDIYSEEFRKKVYDRAGPLDILLFYVSHPDRFYQKLNVSAEASLPLRPVYLGNYEKASYEEILKFSHRFPLWEDLRKDFSGFALPTIAFIFLLFFSNILVGLIHSLKSKSLKEKYLSLALKLMLLFMAVSQFILPVIGNGEADLAKHMFLFNVLIDSIIFLMVSEGINALGILKLRKEKLKNYAVFLVSAVLLVSALFFITRPQDPKTMIFGQYQNKKLVWDIAQETDKYYLLVAHDIVAKKPFDNDPNNLWNESDIRSWLNSNDKDSFLEQFSQDELKRILPVEMKSVVSPVFDKKRTVGTQQLYWSALPGDTTQNYADAYGIIDNEQIFLLSVKDWECYTFNKKKDTAYWLRTPYSNIDAVRIVDTDGYVYHKRAMEKDIGVLPAVYVAK